MHLQPRVGFFAGLALALLLSGCASTPTASTGVSFVVIRHAEKASDGSKDPPLADAGQTRARTLAERLRDQPVRAAYATTYRRTQMTAMPTAQSHGLTVGIYDADLSAEAFAAQLRRDHADGHVLVVGHSNTAPQIAAALCGCTVAPMTDTEFDRLMTVRIDANGQATLSQDRY